MKSLILFLFSINLSFAEVSATVTGESVLKNGKLELDDNQYMLLANELTNAIRVVPGVVKKEYKGLTAEQRIAKVIEKYNLNAPENKNVMTGIIASVSMNIAFPVASHDYDGDGSIKFSDDSSHDVLEKVLTEYSVQIPKQFYESREVMKSAMESKADHKKFLDLAKSRLSDEQLRNYLYSAQWKFKYTPDRNKDFIKEVIKGPIDQVFLRAELENLIRGTTYTGLEDSFDNELFELLIEKYDFNTRDQLQNEKLVCAVSDMMFQKTVYSIKKNKGEDPTIGQRTTELTMAEVSAALRIRKIIEDLAVRGSDIDAPCNNGLSAKEQMDILNEEGFYTEVEENFNFSGLPGFSGLPVPVVEDHPCVEIIGGEEIALFCDIHDVIARLSNELAKNKEYSTKVRSRAVMNFQTENKKCDFELIDLVVKSRLAHEESQVSLTATPFNSEKSFVLKGKDREVFLKKLKEIIKY